MTIPGIRSDDAVTPSQLARGPIWDANERTTRRVQHPVFIDAPRQAADAAHHSPSELSPDEGADSAGPSQDGDPSTSKTDISATLAVTGAQGDLERILAEPTHNPGLLQRLFPVRTPASGVDYAAVMRAPVDRPVTFVVAQSRGEAGKTVTTFGLGNALASARGGGVVALDNNEAPGDLADRVERTTDLGLRDLLEHADYFINDPSALGVELERVLQHQSTGFLEVLASDPIGGPAITATEFATIHAVLRKYFRFIVIDTGNSTRSANWQAAISMADVILVPIKLRPDHIVPAAKMIQGLRESGEDVDSRVLLVVSCGPDDRHISPDEQTKLFSDLHLTGLPLMSVPTDPVLNRGPLLRWASLRQTTRQAYAKLGAAGVLMAQQPH